MNVKIKNNDDRIKFSVSKLICNFVLFYYSKNMIAYIATTTYFFLKLKITSTILVIWVYLVLMILHCSGSQNFHIFWLRFAKLFKLHFI